MPGLASVARKRRMQRQFPSQPTHVEQAWLGDGLMVREFGLSYQCRGMGLAEERDGGGGVESCICSQMQETTAHFRCGHIETRPYIELPCTYVN